MANTQGWNSSSISCLLVREEEEEEEADLTPIMMCLDSTALCLVYYHRL